MMGSARSLLLFVRYVKWEQEVELYENNKNAFR